MNTNLVRHVIDIGNPAVPPAPQKETPPSFSTVSPPKVKVYVLAIVTPQRI